MRKILTVLTGLIMTLQISACQKQEVVTVKPDLSQLTEAAIERVSSRKVIFGHMSVGDNILDGLRRIQEEDVRFRSIRIKEYRPGLEVVEPGIYHYYLGNNESPGRKIAACNNLLLGDSIGGRFDAAVFKYCYVDIKLDADPDRMLEDYSAMVSGLKERFPDLTIVHVTVPLTSDFPGLKGRLKSLLGREHPNEKRSYFNSLMIEKYGASDLVFDLARVESTDSRGNRVVKKAGERDVYYLSKEYTTDGGHLNETGQILAALEFMKTLARIE